ncbi:MAG: hypothetical protein AAFY45_27905, partial [Bacteroidota bacterium]
YTKVLQGNSRARKGLRNRKVNVLELELDLLDEMEKSLAANSTSYEKVVLRKQYAQAVFDREDQYRKKKSLLLIPSLMNLYDQGNLDKILSQAFMVRFDKAHDQVDENLRVLEVISFGLPAK